MFRTIYAPVKQLMAAFSPDNESGFKRVVLVEDSSGAACVLGFLTREFALDRGRGLERLTAVYVPTNHLYLGDVLVFPAERVVFPTHGGAGHPRLPDGRHGARRPHHLSRRDPAATWRPRPAMTRGPGAEPGPAAGVVDEAA